MEEDKSTSSGARGGSLGSDSLKGLEDALKDQLSTAKYVWALDNEPVNINNITTEALLKAINTRATAGADPDGPLWAGKYASKKEAYAHCAVAFGILRLAPISELKLIGHISDLSKEIEDMQVEQATDRREIKEHAAELLILRNDLRDLRRRV